MTQREPIFLERQVLMAGAGRLTELYTGSRCLEYLHVAATMGSGLRRPSQPIPLELYAARHEAACTVCACSGNGTLTEPDSCN